MSTTTTQTHLSFCTDHVDDFYLPDDPSTVWSEGFCRDKSSVHDVTVTMTEPNYGDPVRCELYSEADNWLTPDQMRDLAALLIHKTDVLEAVIAPEAAAATAASYEAVSNGARALIDSRNGDPVNVQHLEDLAEALGIRPSEMFAVRP